MILCATYTCYYNLVSPVDVAREREVYGDLFLWDMGEGLGFRPGVFDGAIRSVFAMNTILALTAASVQVFFFFYNNFCLCTGKEAQIAI